MEVWYLSPASAILVHAGEDTWDPGVHTVRRGAHRHGHIQDMSSLVALCQRRPCGAERLLLPDDNPDVERELLRRTASGKGVGPAGWVEKTSQGLQTYQAFVGLAHAP